MFALGLILPICYVAGYIGATIPTQWPVLSALLPLSLWRARPSRLTLRWLGGLFIPWFILCAALGESNYSMVLAGWQFFIWALAFHLGSTISDLRPLWKGLAVGLSISSLVALAQACGAAFPATDGTDFHGHFPGLLYNPVLQGISIALVLTALAPHGLWQYTPVLAIGLVLSGSRGAWLVLALTLIARLTHWTISLAALALGAIALQHFAGDSDIQRLQIWGIALRSLTPLGWGPGAFNDIFAIIPDAVGPQMTHLEFAHNDFLQLAFDYGVGALLPLAAWACVLSRTRHPDWPVLFAATLTATFFFPLYAPLTAFILCTVAGHIAVDWDRVWGVRLRSRLAQLSRLASPRCFAARIWRKPVPMES